MTVYPLHFLKKKAWGSKRVLNIKIISMKNVIYIGTYGLKLRLVAPGVNSVISQIFTTPTFDAKLL